jgi:ATPase family associated with various cellular activities (AAA)
MENLYQQKIVNASSIFDSNMYKSRILYIYQFNKLPSIQYITTINGEKVFAALKEKYANSITHVHTYRQYNKKKKKNDFDETIVMMNNNLLLELDDDYCEILHDGLQDDMVRELTLFISQFKERQRREPLEINLIVKGMSGLDLKAMEIKKTALNLELFYEDGFAEIDEVIRKRLNKKKDKGIVLLHGLPGTGKTTYLRHLIGKIKKKVLFLSPTVAENLMSPEFIELLIDNPETVVVIEDAENILMDRRASNNSAVSNLLNISDGLLADFLNVQLICTFNSSVTLIDEALMRKGRLIAKYEFGKLSTAKAQALSNHLGFDTTINKPMTVAEIANQHEKKFATKQVQVIGFRRMEELIEN